jgi:hypothetical protein
MQPLLDTWQELRSSAYSGDFALVLIVWGSLRAATGFEGMTVAAIALGAGLFSASLDLMPERDE